MEKSKIIATLGPSSNSASIIEKMALSGVDGFRINMSHSTHEANQLLIDEFKKARKNLSKPLSLIIDTKGPEIRVGNFENGKVVLVENQTFTFTKDNILGNNERVSVSYKKLIDKINVGDSIFANNGMLSLKVKSKNSTEAVCKVIYGGKLTNHKGLNVPSIKIDSPFLSDRDKDDLLFAIKNDADYIAASFVSSKDDVKKMREFLDENGGNEISIISKIENGEAINNINDIIDISDGIMFARGDLGVEIPLYKLPPLQKKIVKLCNAKAKICLIATEMLESMTTNLRPTRAEVSDVANAVYDYASATMLSGETAVGKNPVLTVKTMTKIIKESEKNINYKRNFLTHLSFNNNVVKSLSTASLLSASGINAKLIAVYTTSGTTAKNVASERTGIPLICLTPNEKQKNKLSLVWSAQSFVCPKFNTKDTMKEYLLNFIKENKLAKSGDYIVATYGENFKETNMFEIIKL